MIAKKTIEGGYGFFVIQIFCNGDPNPYISYEGNVHQLARQIKTTKG